MVYIVFEAYFQQLLQITTKRVSDAVLLNSASLQHGYLTEFINAIEKVLGTVTKSQYSHIAIFTAFSARPGHVHRKLELGIR